MKATLVYLSSINFAIPHLFWKYVNFAFNFVGDHVGTLEHSALSASSTYDMCVSGNTLIVPNGQSVSYYELLDEADNWVKSLY